MIVEGDTFDINVFLEHQEKSLVLIFVKQTQNFA